MLIRQPNLVLAMSLFVYEILDDQFSSKDHFPLIQYWGHTFTVDLLLQRRADISAYYVRLDFESVAKNGRASAVSLLQRHIDINADGVFLALIDAVMGRHSSASTILLL
jgi:hypothetical protein